MKLAQLALFDDFAPGVVVGDRVSDPLKRTWPRGIDRAMADWVRSRRVPPAAAR